ncbi:hypothetical protein FOZ63_018376, partial [Perkinsus olseni]
ANHMGRKEEETIDNKRIKQMRMQYCTLSHTLLYKNPVVVCRKGNMYSKEALYTALLEGKTKASSSNSKKKKKAHDHHHADDSGVVLPEHIKKIKDVRTATIEWIDDVDITKDRHCTFRCPITRKDLDDGSTSVIMLWPCGCIMAKECITHQQKGSNHDNSTTTCMNCGARYDPSKGDVIIIAPNDDTRIHHHAT